MNIPFPHRATFTAALLSGLKLCKVNGNKRPDVEGWNLPGNEITDVAGLPEYTNAGILLVPSGRASIDLDDLFMAQTMFAERGIDLQALLDAPDAVQIVSGRPGSGKLIYAMPEGLTLPSKSLKIGAKNILEFRNSTAEGKTVQDVCPGSKHPSGTTYQWGGSGDWTNPPQLPAEILAWWQELLEEPKHESAGAPAKLESLDEVKGALVHIPASCAHDTWLECLMGLHSTGHPDAYELARQWSSSCPEKYPGDHTFNQRWRSFSQKPNGITIASLFHHAAEHGWIKPPPVDVLALFDAPPENILDSMFMPPPTANLKLFPAGLLDPAIEVSESIGCDPMVPLFAGLGTVMAAIDARTRLTLWHGYQVPPVLWLGGIGSPSDKKSPGSQPMYAVLADIERDDVARFKLDMLRWEVEEAAYAAAKKDLVGKGSSADHMPEIMAGDALAGLPTLPQLRTMPVPKRLVIGDSTTQKTVRLAADRPEGLLANLDETLGFLRKLTNPTGTEDRSALVAGYNVGRYFMDRVGAGSIVAENLAIALYACFQPDVLKQYAPLLKSDGFIQRFVFAVFNPKYRRASKPIPAWSSVLPQWEHLVRQIHAAGERHYTLSEKAYRLMRAFEVEVIELTNRYETAQYSPMLVTALGKLLGTTGRLMLLFHMIEDRDSPTVSEATARNAIEFVRSYVVPSWHHVTESILGDESLDRHVCEVVIQHADEPTISLSTLKRGLRRQLEGVHTDVAGEKIRGVMGQLVSDQWVAIVEDSRKSTVWAINPGLAIRFAAFRKKVVDSKAAIREAIQEAAAVRRSEKKV